MNRNLGYWHCLDSVKGLGPSRFKSLLLLFKTPNEVYKLSREQIFCIKGIDEKIADAFIESKDKLNQCITKMDEELRKAESLDASILTLNDKEYPVALKETNVCPPLLFFKGSTSLLNKTTKTIGIVGTRQVGSYGASVALSLSKELAGAGWTIVSGMAKGTDSLAHRGAIECGGKTFAVLGCGVDVIYPPEAKDLYSKILQHGGIFSEYSFGTKINDLNLKKRNKITVGLSRAVVIIETSDKGGTMNAVTAAFEQKKQIFVLVPKDRNNPHVAGNLKLIEEGKVIPITEANAFSIINKSLSVYEKED